MAEPGPTGRNDRTARLERTTVVLLTSRVRFTRCQKVLCVCTTTSTLSQQKKPVWFHATWSKKEVGLHCCWPQSKLVQRHRNNRQTDLIRVPRRRRLQDVKGVRHAVGPILETFQHLPGRLTGLLSTQPQQEQQLIRSRWSKQPTRTAVLVETACQSHSPVEVEL